MELELELFGSNLFSRAGAGAFFVGLELELLGSNYFFRAGVKAFKLLRSKHCSEKAGIKKLQLFKGCGSFAGLDKYAVPRRRQFQRPLVMSYID